MLRCVLVNLSWFREFRLEYPNRYLWPKYLIFGYIRHTLMQITVFHLLTDGFREFRLDRGGHRGSIAVHLTQYSITNSLLWKPSVQCPSISQISYLLVASKKGGLGRSVRVNWVGGRLLAALGDKLDRAHILQHCLAFFPFYCFHTLKVDCWSITNIYNIGLSILFRRRKV